jgi:dTDP-4-amino-4,6-dideoxygalactose transaminase
VAKAYREQLAGVPGITVPREMDGGEPVYHLFVVRCPKRENLIEALKKQGIQTGIHYPIGLPFLKAYEYLKHQPADFPLTHAYQAQILSLPMYAEMTLGLVTEVVEAVKAFVKHN